MASGVSYAYTLLLKGVPHSISKKLGGMNLYVLYNHECNINNSTRKLLVVVFLIKKTKLRQASSIWSETYLKEKLKTETVQRYIMRITIQLIQLLFFFLMCINQNHIHQS